MSSKGWDEIERLYFDALARPPAERRAFLDAATQDAALRREVLEMLDASDDQHALGIEQRLAAGDAVAAVRAADRIGERVGAYRLTGLLGRGGMGEVYIAERADEHFQQVVAIKLLRAEARTPEMMDRFRAERQILAQLNHPHIARLLDGGMTGDGHPYLVMPAIHGVPITDYCDEHALPIAERLRLFVTVCGAVQFAHQNLVVHRDLKPSNILVTDDGTVKLLDFGIAKLLEPQTMGLSVALTRTEFRVMTPEYAAPEQLRGETATTAADVYGLGILLYELLTGHHPFELVGKTRSEIERIVCEEDPPRPSEAVRRERACRRADGNRETVTPAAIARLRGMAPAELRRRLRGDLGTIVQMALRKEPRRRYATAGQLAEDIGRFQRSMPVIARPDTPAYRMRKFTERHRAGVVAAGVVAIVMVLAGVITLSQARQVSRERDLARLEQEKSEQVVQVLVNLFESRNPTIEPGPDTLTVRTFLEQSETRIIEDLEGQPELQARMRHVLGSLYRSRSQLTRARELFQQAYEQQRQLAGPEDPTTASAFHDLAALEARLRGAAAEPMLRESLALQRRIWGDRHPNAAQAMQDLGGVVADEEERIALIRGALDIYRAQDPVPEVQIASGLNQLAGYHHGRREYARAAELYEEALAIVAEELGENHPDVLTVTQNLATCHTALGDYDVAEVMLRRVIELRLEIEEGGGLGGATSLNNLAVLLVQKHDYAGAAEVIDRAVEIYRRVFGDEHGATANAIRNRAYMSLFLGDGEEALRYMDQAVAMQRAFEGDSSGATLYMRGQRAIFWLDLGRPTAARDTLSVLLGALQDRLQTADDYRITDTRVALGRAQLATGQPGPAEEHFRIALATRRERRGDTHGTVDETRGGLGLALAARGQLDEALPLLERAVPGYDAWGQATPGFAVEMRSGLAAVYEGLDRPADAARVRAAVVATDLAGGD